MTDNKVLESIDNLGQFIYNDKDFTKEVKSKIKKVIEIVQKEDNISLTDAYNRVINSPIFSLLTDDFVESLLTDEYEIYHSYKSLNNKMKK